MRSENYVRRSSAQEANPATVRELPARSAVEAVVQSWEEGSHDHHYNPYIVELVELVR